MSEQPLDDVFAFSFAAAEGAEEVPPFIDSDRLEAAVTWLATKAFTEVTVDEETDDQDESPDERFMRYIQNSIAAAYIVGAIDFTSQQNPTSAQINVPNSSGRNITVNINVS